MIKVGSMIQSAYTHNGREGNIGIVMKLADPYTSNYQSAPVALARVYYPKTRTSGWVDLKDMKAIA